MMTAEQSCVHSCSRAEVKGALLACHVADFLHCYNFSEMYTSCHFGTSIFKGRFVVVWRTGQCSAESTIAVVVFVFSCRTITQHKRSLWLQV